MSNNNINIQRDDIILVNKQICTRYHKPHSIINDTLDLISEKPDTILFGKHLYNTIYTKLACLIEGIIRMHPFADGNKRTAFGITSYYLRTVSKQLTWSDDIIIQAVKISANNNTDQCNIDTLIYSIANWLENNTTNINEFKVPESRTEIDTRITVSINHDMNTYTNIFDKLDKC